MVLLVMVLDAIGTSAAGRLVAMPTGARGRSASDPAPRSHGCSGFPACGSTPWFPSQAWFPPLIAIDHVLPRHAVASSIRTIDVRGSHHRSLLATVDVPLDPTAS
jgi:hypothetical protein